MPKPIYWILEATVEPQAIAELGQLMEEMRAHVREHEPGTLLYEWHIGEDGATCHILEGYESDAALIAHVEGVNARFAKRMFALLTPRRFTVYGAPGEVARAALKPLKPVYMAPLSV